MLALSTLIPENQILFLADDLTGDTDTVDDLLRLFLDQLWTLSAIAKEGVEKEEIYEALKDRERIQTTAIGEGVAFPHARILGLEGFYNLLIISRKGLNFNSLDQKKAHVFFLSIIPRDNPVVLLKGRSAFISFLREHGGAEGLAGYEDSASLADAIRLSSISTESDITAANLMKPINASVLDSYSLREAARKLHLSHVDSLPVVDEKGCFVGEISCQMLFKIGLPEFFTKLHTISFVKKMNPFENYFKVDRSITVKEIITANGTDHSVPPDTTLMELIFDLSIRNYQTVYVVDEKRKLLGSIDRFSILDQILISPVKKDCL